MNNHSILVTGATGFIGTFLLDRLAVAGYRVTAVVQSSTAGLPDRVTVLRGCAIAPETCWAGKLDGIETVVHLAARVHVMHDTSTVPLDEFRRVNVAGTECLAREAAKAGVRRFIFVSSIKVNGEETNFPYTEDKPVNPSDPYGISKMEAEQALQGIQAETGMEVVIIRPPLVYGPGVKANFYNLMKIVNSGMYLPLGSVANNRSLIYIENLVDAIVTCICHPKAAGQTYLVSDGEDVSTPELVRRVAYALEKSVRIFPFPPGLLRFAGKLLGKSGPIERLVGSLVIDSSKIRRELGWKPPSTMQQGLKLTAEWYLKGLES